MISESVPGNPDAPLATLELYNYGNDIPTVLRDTFDVTVSARELVLKRRGWGYAPPKYFQREKPKNYKLYPNVLKF